MQITYDTSSGKFVATTSYSERDIVKRAGGFRWNPEAKKWETKFEQGPLQLVDYLDADAAERLRKHCADKVENLRASALADSGFECDAPEGKAAMPFQGAGVQYLVKHDGRVLLGDQMGLGKTVQALLWVNIADPKKLTVVCPASIVGVWKQHAIDWLTKDYSIRVLHGRSREVELVTGEFVAERTLTIVAYDNLAHWRENYPEHFDGSDAVFLDECHRIKNAKAKRTAAVLDFAKKAKHVIAMTGTPIVNRPIELWNIVNLIDPETFGNFIAFAKRYAGAHQKSVRVKGRRGFKTVWDFTGATNLDELQEKLRSTIMLRRTKAQVLSELPPKLYTHVDVELSKKALADEQKIIDQFEEYHGVSFLSLLEAGKVDFEDASSLRRKVAIEKLPVVKDYLDTILETEECALVYCHHDEVAEQLRKHCEDMGYGAAVVDGNVPAGDKRDAQIAKFQNGEVRVFIGKITAAGEGITLTRAEHVIMAELDWRPGMNEQAEDRAHRYGQLGNVVVHYLIGGQVEGWIANIVARKVKIIAAAIGTGTNDADPAIDKFSALADQLAARVQTARSETAETAKERKQREERVVEIDLDVVPF